MSSALEFEWRVRRSDSLVVVELIGDLDVYRAPALREALFGLVNDQGARHCAIDLGELTFIDSTGLGVLVSANKSLREVGGDLVLWSVRPPTRRLLELTGLTVYLTIEDGPAAAETMPLAGATG